MIPSQILASMLARRLRAVKLTRLFRILYSGCVVLGHKAVFCHSQQWHAICFLLVAAKLVGASMQNIVKCGAAAVAMAAVLAIAAPANAIPIGVDESLTITNADKQIIAANNPFE